MTQRIHLSPQDRQRVAEAVAAAETTTSGEIVTVLADRSDGYTDVAMAWAALVAFVALIALALDPPFYLGIAERLAGGWVIDWTPREVLTLAAIVAALKFAGMLLIQLWPPLRFLLVPGPVRSRRVRERAERAFRIGAEQRTTGRTGVLLYLSMRERRAEIVADVAIASKVDPEVWGEAMDALLASVRRGAVAEGMAAAVERIGAILTPHFPIAPDDVNELPDRLIEI